MFAHRHDARRLLQRQAALYDRFARCNALAAALYDRFARCNALALPG
jgi:hypothetical protein